MHASRLSRAPRRIAAPAIIFTLAAASLGLLADRAAAAASAGCDGGKFSLVLPGSTVSGDQKRTLPASGLGTSFVVGDAGCGLGTGRGMLTIYAPSIRDTHRLADLIVQQGTRFWKRPRRTCLKASAAPGVRSEWRAPLVPREPAGLTRSSGPQSGAAVRGDLRSGVGRRRERRPTPGRRRQERSDLGHDDVAVAQWRRKRSQTAAFPARRVSTKNVHICREHRVSNPLLRLV